MKRKDSEERKEDIRNAIVEIDELVQHIIKKPDLEERIKHSLTVSHVLNEVENAFSRLLDKIHDTKEK